MNSLKPYLYNKILSEIIGDSRPTFREFRIRARGFRITKEDTRALIDEMAQMGMVTIKRKGNSRVINPQYLKEERP